MVFSKKLGKPFNNPAVMRDHERNAERPKPGEAARSRSSQNSSGAHSEHGADHGAVHHFAHHHPDHAENPSPGMHHTVATYEDGHEDHRDHEDVQGALDHHQEAMGGDGTGGDGEMAGIESGGRGGAEEEGY